MNWWERFLGARDRLGWWTLPVFVMVGLTGAVLAGALATVYYGQQVDALKDETRAGRDELRTAVEDVREAGQEALDAIGSEVDAVRNQLDRELPFEDAASRGIVSVRALIGRAAPAAPTEGASPAPQQGTEEPEPTFREERVGSGFAVAQEGEVVFVATTFAVVADPEAASGIAEVVEVTTPDGTFAAVVHSWDARRDLALLRTEPGRLEVLEWRPSGEDLAPGTRVVVAGVTPTLDDVQIAGQLAHADVNVLVTDLPSVGFLRGAPIVDDAGLVVGIYATRYAPFGAGAGAEQASVPARLLCERMLRNCDALEAEDPEPSPTG